MQRRKFLRQLAAGGAALTMGACEGGAPAEPQGSPQAGTTPQAQPQGSPQASVQPVQGDLPQLEWKMVTSWTKAVDILIGGAQRVADRVEQLTSGKFKIKVYAAGEIVPATEVLGAVQSGSAEMGHTASYYYLGKGNAFAFGTTLPFGLTAQQQNAWLYQGGGLELLSKFYEGFNLIAFPAGSTGVQMGGWFKKEINTLDDLQGLKMRIPGLGGKVMQKLGVVPQQIAAGEIYQALETGAIDATEWVGPYDDEKLGFNKVANFYYYPGWWEPGPTLDLQINLEKWNSLPKEYQEVIRSVTYEANLSMLAAYDAKNGEALNRLTSSGTQLRPYSPEILAAAEKAAFELFDEISAQDAVFKEIYGSWKAFRDSIYAWHKISEAGFTNYVYSK